MVSIKIQQKQLMIFGDCNSFVENYISEIYLITLKKYVVNKFYIVYTSYKKWEKENVNILWDYTLV